MSGTPRFKIHDDRGRYVAATVDASLAAALVGAAGWEGWTVRVRPGGIIWREGREAVRAAESYDHAAEIMYDRLAPRYRSTTAMDNAIRSGGDA